MAPSAVQVRTLERYDGDPDFTALMSRISERDRDAFETLFVHFGPRVKAFMSVWRKADYYAPERGAVSTWIYSIARNARIDRLRRQSSKPYDDISEMEIEASDPDAEEELALVQRADKVAEAMVELPDEQRQIIELAYMHDLPQSEIATRLSLPLGTVKSRMRLAYAKLKQKLEEIR